MTLPRRYVRILEELAFTISRTLYQKLDGVDTSEELFGYEIALEGFSKWQIAFKIKRVADDEIIDITDEELRELEYEELK